MKKTLTIRSLKPCCRQSLWTAVFLILPAQTRYLSAQQIDSLVVAGQTGSAKVIQVDGRNYIEVEGLARLTNGSISFNGNQIVMTLPAAGGNSPGPTPPATGFSKDFVTTALEAMSEIREWRAALKNAIERSYPIQEDWLGASRADAQKALRIASVSAGTPADKDALPFLTNEFNNMSKLSDKYLKLSASMTYIAPASLDSDTLDQKITACARSLASMATANQFVDDGSCR